MTQAQRSGQQSEIRRRVTVCRERLRRSRATQKMVERAALSNAAWEMTEISDRLAEADAGKDASEEEDAGSYAPPVRGEAAQYCLLPAETSSAVLQRIGGAREEARR